MEIGQGLVSLTPGRCDHQVEHRRRVSAHDPLLVDQVGEPDRSGTRQPVVGGECEVDRLGEQLLALDARVGELRQEPPLVGDDHIEVRGLERRKGLLRFEVDHRDAEVGVAVPKPRQHRDEQSASRRGKRRNANAAHDPSRRGCEICFGALDIGQDPLGVGDESDPRFGQSHVPAETLQERGACFSLQDRHLLRYRGGGHEQCLGGGGDGPPSRHLAKHAESRDVQHVANLTICIRNRQLFFSIKGTKLAVGHTRPNRSSRYEEAFQMHDSFSSGGVFYGRTLAIVGGILVLAVLLNIL